MMCFIIIVINVDRFVIPDTDPNVFQYTYNSLSAIVCHCVCAILVCDHNTAILVLTAESVICIVTIVP